MEPLEVVEKEKKEIWEECEEKEQKKGNIIIPDTAREKPMEGKVIAVGAGRLERLFPDSRRRAP